jgi:hypothetical protein
MTPQPTTPETTAQAAARGKGQLVLKGFVAKQVGAHPAWALVSIQHGSGIAMTGVPWAPSVTFATFDACEAHRAQRIQGMAGSLANQFQARSGVTMTETGWKEDFGTVLGMRSERQTVLICAPWVGDS